MNKIPYHELERHFKTPSDWTPGKQAYFDRFRCIPRKMKKRVTKLTVNLPKLSLGQRLWYVQDLDNPNLNRFLIKKVIQSQHPAGDYLGQRQLNEYTKH